MSNPTLATPNRNVYKKIQQILTSEEAIQLIIVQRSFGVNLTPDYIVLTNRRFIRYKPMLFGRVRFEDYIWRDLQDASLTEGILCSTLTFKSIDQKRIELRYLPKEQARRVYAFAQEMEERVREERRRRALEEKRAAAGNISLQSGVPNMPVNGSAQWEDPARKLGNLKNLLEAGFITSGEYEAKRAEIISAM